MIEKVPEPVIRVVIEVISWVLSILLEKKEEEASK